MRWADGPPPSLPFAHDPRLDPYRERAGRLSSLSDGSFFGLAYIQIEHLIEQRGLLWWKRWGAEWRESPLCYVLMADGTVEDWYGSHEYDPDLREWETGRFSHFGRQLSVIWLTDNESEELRQKLAIARQDTSAKRL